MLLFDNHLWHWCSCALFHFRFVIVLAGHVFEPSILVQLGLGAELLLSGHCYLIRLLQS